SDLAFDALAKTFKPGEVVRLRYDLSVPAPDPLTSPASEARLTFYREVVENIPMVLLDGRPAVTGGGEKIEGPDSYQEYVYTIAPLREKPAEAQINLKAVRKDDEINITAEVDKLAEAGDNVRLRLVLVEDKVNYKGKNGQAVHERVVRHMPGGAAG